MVCPHCGHAIEAPPTAINMPLDVTSCAPACNPIVTFPQGISTYQSWGANAINVTAAAGDGPVNITYFSRGIIGGE